MRVLLPFILIIAALGLFMMYTNPAYQGSKAVAAEVASYDSALTTSKQLRAQRDTLTAKRNTFTVDQIDRLERLLPDNVDNIRLIIDINNIAARHGLTLRNVTTGAVSTATTPQSAVAVGASSGPVGSVDLGFTVTSNYDNFIAFLEDLEHSLRLVDVEKLNFKVSSPADSNDYTLTIRTYWLH